MKIVTLVLVTVSTVWSNPVTLDSFSSSNNKFAASVYREVATDAKENFLVSPLSAQLVLALSQSGAKDQTAEEIQNVLNFPQDKQLIDCMTINLLQNFKEEHDYILKTVNKIYVKKDFSLKPEFGTVAKEVYGADIENVDFTKEKETAEQINQWVEKETDNAIHDLISPEILGNETRAILINALRLRGNWSVPFQFFSTTKQDFHTFDRVLQVDTMYMNEERLQYYEKPELKASFLELPILGGNISMTIALPRHKKGLPLLEKQINEVLKAPPVKHQEVFDVTLPKFKLGSKIDFKPILQNLGMKTAFRDGEADFSLIAGEKGELFIDDVVQKTFLDVNEDGLEASAATFVVKIVNRNSETPKEFKVNHPFLFFIKVEDVVLFVGRVITPYY